MTPAPAFVNWTDGALQVPGLQSSEKKLGQLTGIFHDHAAWQQLDPDTIVYRVWWWEPVAPGTEGGLFWGLTEIQPGRVGNEYFMTRGHWHVIRNRAEFYGTISGSGKLLLADGTGHTWAEDMTPGSLHYIAGEVAHRIVNTGDTPIRVSACWPSDAGHDYEVLGGRGFGARVIEDQGAPVLVNTKD
ncbi:MAG: glucose-6-phosphate isomerase family protein [Terriglobales bacterium]|jgi:glucose-6-phosphate isomerase